MDEKKFSISKKLALAALLLAMAIIINRFRIDLPVGGAPAVRLSFGGPFIKLIAIMFGPLFGGFAAAVSDLITFMIAPNGTFMPPLTVVEFVKGFLVGFLWLMLRNVPYKALSRAFLGFFLCLGVVGGINLLYSRYFADSAYAAFLASFDKNAAYVSVGLLMISAIGTLSALWGKLFHADKLVSEKYLKLLVCVAVPGLLGSTVNTFILQYFMLLPGHAFMLLWTPRIIKEMFMIIFNVYVLIVFLNLYERAGLGRAYR